MGFEKTKQINLQLLLKISNNAKFKYLKDSFLSLRNNNIISNSLCLAVILIITRYFFVGLERSTSGFSLFQMIIHSFYSIPICYLAPIIIEKYKVRNTLFIGLIITFVLYLFEIYGRGKIVDGISTIFTPIFTELSYIIMVSYIFSFSTKDNTGLSIGILIGIPYIVSSFLNLTLIQKHFYVIVCLFIFALSMMLIHTLGFNSIGNSGNNNNNNNNNNGIDDGRSEREYIEKSQRGSVISILCSNKFLYLIPASLFIGMINDYSILFIDYGSNIKYYDKIYFISGIFGGISAIIFGALSDNINYKKKSLMQISFVIGLISILLDYGLYFGGSNISEKSFYSLFNLGYLLNSISSSALIVFVFITGSSHFKSNSLSLVSSVRLIEAVGSVITYSYLNWVEVNLNTTVSFYIVPAIFAIGFISLITLESKDSKNINNRNNDFLQYV